MKIRNCTSQLISITNPSAGMVFNVSSGSGDGLIPFPYDQLRYCKISNVGGLQFIPENDQELAFLLLNPIYQIPSECSKRFEKRPPVIPA